MYTSKLNTVAFDNFEIVKNDDLRERAGGDAFSDDMLAMGGYGIAAMSTVACPPACALAVAVMGDKQLREFTICINHTEVKVLKWKMTENKISGRLLFCY